MAEEDSFKVGKQHLLTSYFDLCSAKELENYLVNYQHTSGLLTMDCTAILTCRFRFVVANIDALVGIKLSDLFHGMVVVVVMKQRHFLGHLHNLNGVNILLESSKPKVLDRYCCKQSLHQDWTFY